MSLDAEDYWDVPIWQIVDADTFLRVRVSPMGLTFSHELYSDHIITFYAHYTEARERLVGYSLDYSKSKNISCYFQDWYVGIFSNTKIPNTDLVKIYGDSNIRLFRFNQKKDQNYALCVRAQTPKKRKVAD
jgi:hypothetical protein